MLDSWDQPLPDGPGGEDLGLRNEVERLLGQVAKDFGNQDSATLATFSTSPAVPADGSLRRV
jgi:hypothetical protein